MMTGGGLCCRTIRLNQRSKSATRCRSAAVTWTKRTLQCPKRAMVCSANRRCGRGVDPTTSSNSGANCAVHPADTAAEFHQPAELVQGDGRCGRTGRLRRRRSTSAEAKKRASFAAIWSGPNSSAVMTDQCGAVSPMNSSSGRYRRPRRRGWRGRCAVSISRSGGGPLQRQRRGKLWRGGTRADLPPQLLGTQEDHPPEQPKVGCAARCSSITRSFSGSRPRM